ncbi:MAG TPA: DUF3175 domain-containing protein [Candidatus Krumholzibacteria bacterium]
MASNRTRRSRKVEGRDESTRSGQSRYEGEYRGEYNREYEPGNGGSRYREQYEEPRGRRSAVKRAAGAVGSKVGGMDLDKALVLLHTALALAIVIKQTRQRGSRPRKAEPFRSAMSVLNYYLNEGRELSEMQRATLEDIKEELRMLYNREEEEMMSPAAD